MTTKQLMDFLRPKGEYTKTDLTNYTELSAGRIRAALMKKSLDLLLPIFSLIEDKDSSVASEVEKRVSSLENRFYAHKLDDKYNDSVEEIILASIDATLHGVGIVELYLDENNDFAFRRIGKEFIYFEDGKILLSSGNIKFEPQEPKFIVFRKKPLLLKTLWIVYAKHFVLSHFLKFTEFLGVPPIIVNATDSSEDAMSGIIDQMESIRSGSFAVLGKDDVIKALEGRGSQDDFLKFVSYADSELAKLINGGALTSNYGSAGSLALAQVHERQRGELVAKDIKYAQKCVNYCFSIIGAVADMTIFYEEDKNLLQRAQMLQILSTMGYNMSVEDMSKEFDLPLIKTTAPAQNRRLASNAKLPKLPIDKFDAFLESQSFLKHLSENEMQIKAELERMISEASSFEEAFDALIREYPDMNLDTLEDIFTTVLFNADLRGLIDEDN